MDESAGTTAERSALEQILALTSTDNNYFVVHMADRSLGEFEQIVLLAILRLGDKAYGVTIREEIAARTGREASPGALYTTIARLEGKGLLKARLGDPTPDRGGRAKRFVKLTRDGTDAVVNAQRAYRNLLKGLPLPALSHG